MKHGSLFSGIGGFDLAAEWMGWENVFHCEIGEFGRKVLHHYWPDAISYKDIKTTDFKKHYGAIDIISGGFPCQPFSVAGEQRGTEDDRFLWPEMLRSVKEIGPQWVVAENVPGIVGMALDNVLFDLENQGYTTEAFISPACAVDAPHRRDRVWIVAHCHSQGLQIKRKLSGVFKTQREALPGIERGDGLGQIWSKETGYVEPPICGAGHGIPDRVDRIKALGNAIHPGIAYEIFKAIEQHELMMIEGQGDKPSVARKV